MWHTGRLTDEDSNSVTRVTRSTFGSLRPRVVPHEGVRGWCPLFSTTSRRWIATEGHLKAQDEYSFCRSLSHLTPPNFLVRKTWDDSKASFPEFAVLFARLDLFARPLLLALSLVPAFSPVILLLKRFRHDFALAWRLRRPFSRSRVESEGHR